MSDSYTVEISKRALKEIAKLPKDIAQRVMDQSADLEGGHPNDAKKLKGEWSDFWRTKVGDYRVIYSVDEEEGIIVVERVGHRKDVYRP
jgi:mRNA interferase RelE/StbE